MNRYSNFLLLCLLFISTVVKAQRESQPENDKTQSPYFLVSSGEDRPEEFILESTNVDVSITGPIADVTVNQRYANRGKQPIEAIYVFPASVRAAVYGMEMKIGDRVIKAKIKEKQQARQQYETAKKQGKRASLLEQHNPNVFQMNVANILPGDVVEVILKYNEFLVPENREYTFVYPTVMGPRFTGEDQSNQSFTSNPYLKEGEKTLFDFDINVQLVSPIHIQSAGSISHTINSDFSGKSNMTVSLDDSERDGANRDFIFKYSVADAELAVGTSFYDHGDEKFFLSVIEPPKKIETDDIVPREYIFIVDVSGSMNGFPLDVSKELMTNLLGQLRPDDSFNVLAFASVSSMMFPNSVAASKANISIATNIIGQQRGGGGTNMLSAIKRAMRSPKQENTSRSFVIITDGYVSVEREAFQYIEDNLSNANFFSFGIGSGVNRYIIDGIAHIGRGEPFVITDKKYAKKIANKFKKYIESPLLTNVEVEIEGMDVYDVTPKQIPDLMAERPIYVFGKYRGKPKGELKVSGIHGREKYDASYQLSKETASNDNKALRYLWAREKIRYLSDFQSLDNNEKEKKQIVQLGLKYNLLTSFTSFLAIEDVPVLANGNNTKTVKQALPLPQGVSNYAIGFEMGATNTVDANATLDESLLYVHIEENCAPQLIEEITKIINDALRFTDEEARKILNENQLSIVSNEGRLEISDANKLLTTEMKEKMIKHLNKLKAALRDGQTINVELIWL